MTPLYSTNFIRKRVLFALLCAAFVISGFVFLVPVLAQNSEEASVSAREAELRAELAVIEQEIAKQQGILREKQRETVSLERDVSILNAEIAEAQLNIRAKNIAIERLGKDINAKNEVITDLSGRIERGKESIAELIRKTNETDSFSVVEVVLSNRDLSEFFADLDSYDSIQKSLQVLFDDIRSAKASTESEREVLSERKRQENDARLVIEAEKRKIEVKEAEKKRLLNISRSEEKSYEDVLKEREARAAEIRSALFRLRDTAAIPFGTALQYANRVHDLTGVRPAFLLAILTQESNLGENVGTCNREGDPPEKGWRNIMKPSRDHEPYLRITSALGLNPETMPLSCPWGNGWGGAMGPSQFIPSTWEIYADDIARRVGVSVANPWEPEHAFTASALFLADLGAARGGYSDEREAALRYYAGGNWNKPHNAFYGNQVMAKAQHIQETMIDPLQGL